MIHQFAVSLHSCGSCVSHSHCPACFERAVEDLLCKSGIRTASSEPRKKCLTLTSSMSREDLIDLMDDMGIFVED